MIHSFTKLTALVITCLLNVNCAKDVTEETIPLSAASLKFTAETTT